MFTDPVKNLKAFGLHENMIVADLGAGTGFYAVAAGHMVPHGKVYAVEVQKDFLEKIKHKVKDAHLNNVEILWGNVEKIGGTKIKDRVVDAVLASNILFQIEDKEKFIEETKRILKPEGRVLLIERTAGFVPGSQLETIIPRNKALEMFENKGFVFMRDINVGAEHYGMILRRQ